MIGSWDGNGDGEGPDLLDISVPGLGALMHSTFFNNTEGDRSGLRLQSFPDPYLQGYHKGYNGAVAHHSFNIPFLQGRDATYKLSYTFDHRGPLDLVFQGLTFPQPNLVHVIQDEYWGIASLTVKTD